eukprot:7736340-Ditylum_brightwellii.AAC.1
MASLNQFINKLQKNGPSPGAKSTVINKLPTLNNSSATNPRVSEKKTVAVSNSAATPKQLPTPSNIKTPKTSNRFDFVQAKKSPDTLKGSKNSAIKSLTTTTAITGSAFLHSDDESSYDDSIKQDVDPETLKNIEKYIDTLNQFSGSAKSPNVKQKLGKDATAPHPVTVSSSDESSSATSISDDDDGSIPAEVSAGIEAYIDALHKGTAKTSQKDSTASPQQGKLNKVAYFSSSDSSSSVSSDDGSVDFETEGDLSNFIAAIDKRRAGEKEKKENMM